MKYLLLAAGLFLSMSMFVACGETPDVDLTTLIVGEYSGVVALNLDTDSLKDVPDQRIRISKVDNSTVEIEPVNWPESSPVKDLTLTATLLRTPDGLVNTDGVSLTIALASFNDGTVEGTPYLISGGVASDDGKFENNTGEILFTLQVITDGVDRYELFEGIKQ
ncbi:MAG: hypothetical protein AAFQ68_04205 [Bacteroidota bacterium]